MLKCEFCGNENPTLFFTFNNQMHCRVCISFKHNQAIIEAKSATQPYPITLDIPFSLTPKQQIASQQIKATSKHQDVLVYAVCGAGKTELVLETIHAALLDNKKIGWAIARREVVLQLQSRLASYFKHSKVIAVTQGYTSALDGDLIICTTHQLYRYHQVFDLLILDEPDAFPYKGNSLLKTFMKNSVKGHIIYLTATPEVAQLDQVKAKSLALVTLFERPFHHPIPKPKILMSPLWLMTILCGYLIKKKQKWLIFVPTKKLAKRLSFLLQVPYITSDSDNKHDLILDFIHTNDSVLISTTILERGVTFSNVHVIIYQANHPIFDQASLIQCSGRVGRDKNFPVGDCWFLVNEKSKEVNQCVQTIKQANHSVFGV